MPAYVAHGDPHCRPAHAAIYLRVSTADQHVESQLYDLRELAAKRGFEVVKEYQDCGVSGRRARRPGLDALITDARQKKFSVCLVAAFDRVARSVKHFLQVMGEFDSLGVVFISRRENEESTPRRFVAAIYARVSCGSSAKWNRNEANTLEEIVAVMTPAPFRLEQPKIVVGALFDFARAPEYEGKTRTF